MSSNIESLPSLDIANNLPEGTVCELRQFESMINNRGERILLRTGAKRTNRATQRDPASQRAALVLTNHWDQGQTRFKTELDIQSPHMKKALKECVPAYKDLDIEHKTLILSGQPRCVFHYRQELTEYRNRCSRNGDHQAAQHVQYLLDYMATQFLSEIYIYNQLVQDVDETTASLGFADLWMVFVPGELVYTRQNIRLSSTPRQRTILKFKDMNRCDCPDKWCPQSDWVICLYSIDANGEDFGHIHHTYTIKPYEGFRKLSDLNIMPLRFHPDRDAIKRELIARATKFRDLCIGRHHRKYDGVANLFTDKPNTDFLGEERYSAHRTLVEGRIMLDAHSFSEARPDFAVEFSSDMKIFRTDLNQHLEMTDEELLICDHLVAGYSLNEMTWGWFAVEFISDVDYNNDAFDSLIFDQDYKDMILSLVRAHENKEANFDDVIKGKGRGMVFLLHGEPGVGKTLTAESVADYTKKPLLRLQAETLGCTAQSVEHALASAFHLATKWNAVALLDEADVFLDQRDSANMERCCLVSVFLRSLEYYEGILFLTTNRVSSFDRAFKSRVHLAVRYPALDFAARQKIWKLFLGRLPNEVAGELIASGELKNIQDEGLNGRQIKNIVRTAHSLAVSDPNRASAALELEDFHKALRAMKKFNADFAAAYRGNGGDDVDDGNSSGKKRRRPED